MPAAASEAAARRPVVASRTDRLTPLVDWDKATRAALAARRAATRVAFVADRIDAPAVRIAAPIARPMITIGATTAMSAAMANRRAPRAAGRSTLRSTVLAAATRPRPADRAIRSSRTARYRPRATIRATQGAILARTSR